MWLVSLIGIQSTAVVCGTDMFFLTCGRPALRLASSSAGTEVMGFFHMFGDARMPIWGVSAILSNLLLAVLSRSEQRWFYLTSLFMLILFVIRLCSLVKTDQSDSNQSRKKRRTPRQWSRATGLVG